eukprot:677709-Rhodomonas_salina.1
MFICQYGMARSDRTGDAMRVLAMEVGRRRELQQGHTRRIGRYQHTALSEPGEGIAAYAMRVPDMA